MPRVNFGDAGWKESNHVAGTHSALQYVVSCSVSKEILYLILFSPDQHSQCQTCWWISHPEFHHSSIHWAFGCMELDQQSRPSSKYTSWTGPPSSSRGCLQETSWRAPKDMETYRFTSKAGRFHEGFCGGFHQTQYNHDYFFELVTQSIWSNMEIKENWDLLQSWPKGCYEQQLELELDHQRNRIQLSSAKSVLPSNSIDSKKVDSSPQACPLPSVPQSWWVYKNNHSIYESVSWRKTVRVDWYTWLSLHRAVF